MTDKNNKELKFEWKCPKCSAPANNHGEGGRERCDDRMSRSGPCFGFLCECIDNGRCESTGLNHGEVLSDPCKEAHCFHCGWVGTFPKPPKKAQDWEKKALAAGWAPPPARAKELGV
jgi:hypothetical protein